MPNTNNIPSANAVMLRELNNAKTGNTASPYAAMPLAYTTRGPNRSASNPDTGSSAAISNAAAVTAISTGTRARCNVPVAYEIANTPQVLKAAPSPQRDSSPSNVDR